MKTLIEYVRMAAVSVAVTAVFAGAFGGLFFMMGRF